MDMKKTVKQWLETGTVDIFLGYRNVDDHPIPHGFTRESIEEIEDLIDSKDRYSLEKLATHLRSRHPEAIIGMFARDCNKRALNVLAVWNQVEPDTIKTLDLNCCPSQLKKNPACSYLKTEKPGKYKIQAGLVKSSEIEKIETFDQHERLARWMYELGKCIKCYGCRNICPVCFCRECSLEHTDLIHSGRLPPEVPLFHLVRATHMAGRCVDCGLCEEACPMDIPLRLLYRKVNQIVGDVFEYETGISNKQPPFSVLGDKVTLTPRELVTAQDNGE